MYALSRLQFSLVNAHTKNVLPSAHTVGRVDCAVGEFRLILLLTCSASTRSICPDTTRTRTFVACY